MAYVWYALAEGSDALEQGDMLDKFPIINLPEGIADAAASGRMEDALQKSIPVQQFDVIILTKSCDFPKLTPTDEVILCPRLSYEEAARISKKVSGQDGWSKLRRGHIVGLHLIDKCDLDGRVMPYQVIDLQRVFTSPLQVVRRHAARQGKRVRLCPPYREHLAEAFARQFMRVDLPIDLPEKSPYVR